LKLGSTTNPSKKEENLDELQVQDLQPDTIPERDTEGLQTDDDERGGQAELDSLERVSESTIDPALKACRICYGCGQRQPGSREGSSKPEMLLSQICKCKGTQKYVHESCLIRWIDQRNTEKCEVCLQKYNITYKLGSIREILGNGLSFFFRDR